MASRYRIQVIDTRDKSVVATWPPGLATEQDVIADIVDRVRQKEVGFMQREAHVLSAVRQAIEEGFHDLKSRVPAPR